MRSSAVLSDVLGRCERHAAGLTDIYGPAELSSLTSRIGASCARISKTVAAAGLSVPSVVTDRPASSLQLRLVRLLDHAGPAFDDAVRDSGRQTLDKVLELIVGQVPDVER